MASDYLKTSDIATELAVHPNTIRIYETQGFLSKIPRDPINGYRQFSAMQMEQARLARMTLRWPYLVPYKSSLEMLVRHAADGNYEMAMELAFDYLAKIRVERTYAESAIAFLERWAEGYVQDTNTETMYITEAAQYLDVSVDMLRNWERNGLIDVPRDPKNSYRRYGTSEFGRLRVIRLLVQSGHSLMAILRMFQQLDSGETEHLSDALNMPLNESANDAIEVNADRWMTSLFELEERAQATIRQIRQMIAMSYTTK